MSDSLEARIRQLEDRNQISECVIRYAASLDKADWELIRPLLRAFEELNAEHVDTIDEEETSRA